MNTMHEGVPTEKARLLIVAGPCVVEDEEMPLRIAEDLARIFDADNIRWVFKASYKKANRTRLDSFTGIGDERALRVLAKVREQFGVPILTDVHTVEECAMAAEYVDVLQIPAFLCRQTELLVAAGKTGKPVNIKKGQFMSPTAMRYAIEKVQYGGSSEVWLTERGTTFGYQDLVVDFRGIVEMRQFVETVLFDATHSMQKPNASSGVTGGNPKYILPMCRAAIAVGATGLFIETHPEPSRAKSDGANMLPLQLMPRLVEEVRALWQHIQSLPSL